MTANIQDHYNDEEIIKVQIEPDSLRWKEMLEFNNTEVEFLRKLLFYNFTEKVNSNLEYNQKLLKNLDKLQEANEMQLNRLFNFRKNLYKFDECDEILCENRYLKEFFTLKELLTQHFKDFRHHKKLIFDYFGRGFDSKFEQKNYFI